MAVKKSRVLGTASAIGTIKVTAQEFPGLQQEQHTASSAQEAVSRAWDQKCSKKKILNTLEKTVDKNPLPGWSMLKIAIEDSFG